jgi:succinate dehydrogenase / fumarate reductase cytochrome b subunit
MAATGSVFMAYVLVHMAGNLKVFLGAEQLDAYAASLRTLLVPIVPHESVLWSFRVVLLACLVIHVAAAVMLTRRSQASRGPVERAPRLPAWRSFTSRTMMVSGIVIGGFLVFHILDLTLGVTAGSGFRPPVEIDGEVTVFAYDNLVDSFRRPLVAIVYIVANGVLGAHLLHGGWSVVHDLGVTGQRARRGLTAAATAIAVAVVVGNVAIPVAVLVGLVR